MSSPEKMNVAESKEVVVALVRDILEALCVRDGISLDSEAVPGSPARNYELALRLGIGQVFGLREDEGSSGPA